MGGFTPTQSEFIKLATSGYNVIPVYTEVIADLLTPIGAFMRLGLAEKPYAFLLESVEGGERLGRYSFLGVELEELIEFWPGLVKHLHGHKEQELTTLDPLAYLEQEMGRFRLAALPHVPRSAIGFVGYGSYELVRYIERLPARKQGLGVPEGIFGTPKVLLIFDHVQNTVKILVNVYLQQDAYPPNKLAAIYAAACRKVASVLTQLQKKPGEIKAPGQVRRASKPSVQSNFTKEAYLKAVTKAKEYITAGDIFQVVLSQRLTLRLASNPFAVYRALRALNPSPYLFYFNFGQLSLVGSSPEVMVRLQDGRATVRPIAGTRPRGKTPAADLAFAKELSADEKERAEHVMLVDLGRNDLGRVCTPGSVQVTELLVTERYSHVMHLVSNVEGMLASGKNQFDLFRATFPAGTLSGTPKVRAMEIIHELEPTVRGPYGGAVGYFGFDGNMDFCITIRTIVCQGEQAWVQAGAGIVADSEPEREYAETLNKARALLRAAGASPNEGRTADGKGSDDRQLRFLHL